MLQSYSFDEGAVLGGPILFKEPDEELARRIKINKIYWMLLPVCLVLAILFPYVLDIFFANKILPGVDVGTAIFSICLVLVLYRVGLWPRTPRTRVTIYKQGVSLGYGPKPFYRFSDLHYVEEYVSEDSQGYEHTNIGLTSSDGKLKECFKELRNEEIYRDFLDILTKHFSELKKGPTWTKEAEALISSMTGPKGPVHYTIEQVALRHHIIEINIEFIRLNWQQVVKEQRRSYDFKKLAKKRWGNLM
jgi:hypothetical protein